MLEMCSLSLHKQGVPGHIEKKEQIKFLIYVHKHSSYYVVK